MNPELLREREAFKKRAMATAAVTAPSKRPKESAQSSSSEASRKPSKSSDHSAKAKLDLAKMKSMGQSGSQFRFGVLAKIVRHMKSRHMEGEDQPLTLEEILDETNQLDTNTKTRLWLEAEALRSNPKISASIGTGPNGQNTYLFKPPYSMVNKKMLLKVLRQHDLKGLGAILLDDIQESLPRCDKVMKQLIDEEKVIVLVRPTDKKKIVFYHDHTADFEIDPEFQKLWRSVAVDSIDDEKISEYLEKQGIRSMEDQGGRRSAFHNRKPRKAAQRKKRAPKDNEHMASVLEDYSEMTAERYQKK